MVKELLGVKYFRAPVKAATKIAEDDLVVMEAGYAVTAKKAASLVALGIARETVDNTNGADGDVEVLAKRGCFGFAGSSISSSDVGKTCYIVDKNTVTTTATGSSAVGKIIKVEDSLVFVEIV